MAGPMSIAANLADLTVLGIDGNAQRLGDLWSDRPALIAFVRHFG